VAFDLAFLLECTGFVLFISMTLVALRKLASMRGSPY